VFTRFVVGDSTTWWRRRNGLHPLNSHFPLHVQSIVRRLLEILQRFRLCIHIWSSRSKRQTVWCEICQNGKQLRKHPHHTERTDVWCGNIQLPWRLFWQRIVRTTYCCRLASASLIFLCSLMLCISAVFVIEICLSVCLSVRFVTMRYCVWTYRLNISLNIFHRLDPTY